MPDQKPFEPSDDSGKIKPSVAGKWMPVAFLAMIFFSVFLMAQIAGYMVDDLENRIRTGIRETFNNLLGQVEFTFNSGSSGPKRRTPSRQPGKDKPVVNSYPALSFEKRAVNLRVQTKGASSGTFLKKNQNGNGLLALRVTSLNPIPGDREYGVAGLLDLGLILRTTKIRGVTFMVRSDTFKKFGFSLWSVRDGKWFRHNLQGLRVGPEWREARVFLNGFTTEVYDPGSGRYSKSASMKKPDFIFWVGWEIGNKNSPAGAKGELQVDNFRFF